MFEINEIRSSEKIRATAINKERERLFLEMIDCRIGSPEFENAKEALDRFDAERN